MSTFDHPDIPFFFVATTATGSQKLGLRTARDERGLADGLRTERMILTNSYRLPAIMSAAAGGGAAGELPLKDQAEVHSQFAQLIGRGVPAVEALDVVGQTVSRAARPAVTRMMSMVGQGTSFSDACAAVGSFDATTAAVYRAAERSGDLAGAAKQLAVTAKRRLMVREKTVTLLIYPSIVLAVSLLVGLGMLTTVVPNVTKGLRQLAESSGRGLPWYTEALAGAGELIRDQWVFSLGVFASIVVAIILTRRLLISGTAALLRVLPVSKDMALETELARFFSVMSAMSGSGVPVADALGVAGRALTHPRLAAEIKSLQKGLVEGGSMRTLIDRVSFFPVATRRLLIAAERSGDLESAFETLAQDHTDAVDRQSARLLGALEPLLIVGIFLLIGTMLLAIMVPMLNISQSVL
ncbi:MAG: type II secretion system F family protein [Planctomycetota bacterium]